MDAGASEAVLILTVIFGFCCFTFLRAALPTEEDSSEDKETKKGLFPVWLFCCFAPFLTLFIVYGKYSPTPPTIEPTDNATNICMRPPCLLNATYEEQLFDMICGRESVEFSRANFIGIEDLRLMMLRTTFYATLSFVGTYLLGTVTMKVLVAAFTSDSVPCIQFKMGGGAPTTMVGKVLSCLGHALWKVLTFGKTATIYLIPWVLLAVTFWASGATLVRFWSDVNKYYKVLPTFPHNHKTCKLMFLFRFSEYSTNASLLSLSSFAVTDFVLFLSFLFLACGYCCAGICFSLACNCKYVCNAIFCSKCACTCNAAACFTSLFQTVTAWLSFGLVFYIIAGMIPAAAFFVLSVALCLVTLWAIVQLMRFFTCDKKFGCVHCTNIPMEGCDAFYTSLLTVEEEKPREDFAAKVRSLISSRESKLAALFLPFLFLLFAEFLVSVSQMVLVTYLVGQYGDKKIQEYEVTKSRWEQGHIISEQVFASANGITKFFHWLYVDSWGLIPEIPAQLFSKITFSAMLHAVSAAFHAFTRGVLFLRCVQGFLAAVLGWLIHITADNLPADRQTALLGSRI